jgi:arylsulfatase B
MSTIANKLKSAGYATHAVGKWHCGFATPEQTPLGRGFDSYFGYFGGFNDYLHAWSEQACNESSCTNHSISYEHSPADFTKCTNSSVHARHLRSTTDLWENTHPAHGLNGTGFEEAQFEERVLGIIAGHNPEIPLYLYYPMHLVHSPLCVPEGYLEKFEFIRDADDNVNHDRQYVAAMVHYLDAIVGNVAAALQDAGLWDNALMVWSSDNGGAVELTTGMKNSYPLRGGYTTNWEGGAPASLAMGRGAIQMPLSIFIWIITHKIY